MRGDPFVSVIISSPPMVCATAMLNGNGFPATLESEAAAAARRLAIFLHHVDVLPNDIEKSNKAFFEHLNRNWGTHLAAVAKRGDVEFIAFADGLGYVARLHSILYELKAFLDLLTRLLCRLVAPMGGGPVGFSRGKVGDLELAGGRLINWLARQSTDALPGRDAIAALFADASRSWITAAVAARDALGHFRELPGFSHMRVSLSKGPATLSPSDILPPQMNGEALTSYTRALRGRLCELASNAVLLAPNVKPELLEKWQTAERYLRE